VRRGSVLVTAMLAVAGAVSLRAQRTAEYEAIVDEYRIGDADAAVRRLARWPPSTISESVRYAAAKLHPEQFAGAAMLHTELGAAIIGSLPSQTNVHLHHAENLLDAWSTRRGERERADAFKLYWYRFVISLYNNDARLDDAGRYAREALARFSRDPVLIFLKGTILELAALRPSAPVSLSLSRGRAPTSATRPEQTLESAAAEFRRALELDPHLAVARLHLGWIQVQHRDDRAQEELTRALADAKDDETRYLAHLFLGGLAERQHHFDEAAKEYELAHRLGDQHQTPFVAWSRVEVARGHPDRARELARQLAALERIDDDPWWGYHLGAVDTEALAWLRAEAHRR